MRTRGHSSRRSGLAARETVALVLLFVLTCLSFIMLDRGNRLDPLKGVLERPIVAAGGLFAGAGDWVSHVGDRFGNVAELRQENERLKAENASLQADAARVQELERENQQLTAQAHFAQQFPQLQLLPARVIYRDPQSRDKYFVINRGSDDGVQIGMAAVSPDFLVGLVTEVEPKTAKVTLIIDQSMHIGVQLQAEPRSPGILDGEWQMGGRLTMKYVDRTVDVKPNTRIITSGLTQRVPKGLLVGYTVSSKKDNQTDSQTIDVWPYANFDSLEAVTIVLNPEQR